LASVAVIVKTDVPVVVGVPERRAVDGPLETSVSPAGSVPAVTPKV
jgi:hypothetical protein